MKAEEIAARKAALQKVRDAFNATAAQINAASDALKGVADKHQPLIRDFNVVVNALNAARPTLVADIAESDTWVPDDAEKESSDGAGVRVVDAEGKVWTLGSTGQTLRAGVHAGGGIGAQYYYFAHAIYTRSPNGSWYKWTGAAWQVQGKPLPWEPASDKPQIIAAEVSPAVFKSGDKVRVTYTMSPNTTASDINGTPVPTLSGSVEVVVP